LIALIILIALVMTSAWLQGKKTKLQGEKSMFFVVKRKVKLGKSIASFGLISMAMSGYLFLIFVSSGRVNAKFC